MKQVNEKEKKDMRNSCKTKKFRVLTVKDHKSALDGLSRNDMLKACVVSLGDCHALIHL